jgi:hypothetical protein
MLLVTVLCSDRECIEERELVVESLDELDGFVCECGYGLVVAAVSRLDEGAPESSVISLPRRPRAPARRAA